MFDDDDFFDSFDSIDWETLLKCARPLTPYSRRTDKVKQAEAYLDKAMKNVKAELYQFIYAINIFKLVPVKERTGLCTNGENIYYNPDEVIGDVAWSLYHNNNKGMENIEKKLVHMLMHGLLGHFQDEPTFRNKELAWAVMDAQVHRLLHKISKKYDNMDEFNWKVEERLKSNSKGYSEYYNGLKNKQIRRFWKDNYIYIQVDKHEYWNEPKNQQQEGEEGKSIILSASGGGSDNKNSKGKNGNDINNKWKEARQFIFGKGISAEAAERQIENMVKQSNKGLEGQVHGYCGGDLGLHVQAAEEGNSYRSFLKEFIEEREVACEDVSTIDPMLYTYGLDMYGDVPIVEPSEVNELKRLNTLVIAIDTSGSCGGDVASRFVRETSAMLSEVKDSVKFDNIYLFQCDTRIVHEECYSYPEDLDDMEEMDLYGFGGTDFRPVFNRIKELVEEENIQVDGLIYLSDACGDFPKDKPDYPVYFVLPESECIDGKPRYNWAPDWVNYKMIEED